MSQAFSDGLLVITELLQELRRGADRAEIYSLSFNNASKYIAVSSDKGTIHIFSLSEGVSGIAPATGSGAVPTLEDAPAAAVSFHNAYIHSGA